MVTIASRVGVHFFLTKNGWDQLIGFDLKVYGQGPGPFRKGHSLGFLWGIKLRPLDKPIPGKVPEMPVRKGYNFRAWGWRIGFFFVIDSKKKKRRFCEGLLPNNFFGSRTLVEFGRDGSCKFLQGGLRESLKMWWKRLERSWWTFR